MKGFNFEEYLNNLRANYNPDNAYDYATDLGDSWEAIIDGTVSLGEAQAMYLDAQQKKHTEMYEYALDSININSNDDFLVGRDSNDFDSMINYNMQTLPMDGIDNRIQTILSGIMTADAMSTPDAPRKAEALRGLLRGYIEKGYNMYPLMTCMNKHLTEYFKRHPELAEESGDLFGESRATFDSLTTLEVAENEVSPYNDIFVLSELLGNKLIEQRTLLGRDADASSLDSVEQDIEALRGRLTEKMESFDPIVLKSILKDKGAYIKESKGAKETFNDAMYQGLHDAAYLANGLSKQTTAQAQSEGM